MKNEQILKVEQLKKYFPVGGGLFQRRRGFIKAVDGVSLSVQKGGNLGPGGRVGLREEYPGILYPAS